VAAVADEEFASVGAQALVRAWPADAAIVTEPTALDVCVAHRGFAWWDVEVEGFAAHGSRPEVGVDAIAKTGRLLTGIEELDRRLRAGEGHPYVGTGSVHASLIEGGQELSSYPERCRLQVERRTAPGESEAVVQAELDALLDEARAADPAFRASGRITLVRDPFAVDPDERVVRGVRDAAARVLGRTPDLVGHGAWMDAAILSAAGIPTVVLGPAGDGHHGVEEWVDLASVQATADILHVAIDGLCGPA
jgi:acetylornithine deacetylase